jgi:hypothetical protein
MDRTELRVVCLMNYNPFISRSVPRLDAAKNFVQFFFSVLGPRGFWVWFVWNYRLGTLEKIPNW